jgi:hypothetical protein
MVALAALPKGLARLGVHQVNKVADGRPLVSVLFSARDIKDIDCSTAANFKSFRLSTDPPAVQGPERLRAGRSPREPGDRADRHAHRCRVDGRR